MKHKTRTKTLSIMLSLVLMLSLVPGMSLTAYAAPTETLLTTITGTGSNASQATSANVSYSTEGVATLTFSGSVSYQASPAWGWWGYSWTATVTPAEGYIITKCIFYDDANRTATDSKAPFVVETTEEDKTPRINGTPIDGGNSQSKGLKKIEVYGYATPAADGDTSTYTLTIPATLNVTASGWNATGGISATGTLESGKKLTVTASSANSWALKSGDNSVGYNLATATGTYSSSATPASWEFTAAEVAASGGTNKGMGIIVEDYSAKPAGTYTDTVTFTASVKDAAPATVLSGALVDGATIKVNFKWRDTNRGDYVQGVYNASSGTFTVTKGGDYWGTGERAVYKVEKIGDNIIIGAGYYDYDTEAMVWSFDTTNDTYTYTQGRTVSSRPSNYGLISVTLNGTDITSQLTQN